MFANLIEDRCNVATKLPRVFAHRKMAELLHNGDLGAPDGSGGAYRVVGAAGKIVLPGKQIERTSGGVDPFEAAAQVAIHPVEVQIALEDARPALLVAPQGLCPRALRTLRRDQAGDQRRAHFPAMDVGPIEPARIVPGRLIVSRLEPDQGAEFAGVLDRKIENNSAADRAAQDDRLLQRERPAKRENRLCVARRREAIFFAVPALRRVRLAMPWHVEGNDPEILREFLISEKVPPLPSVGARRVQADQRYSFAILLEIDAIAFAADLDVNVPADDRLTLAPHAALATRGSASRSLKYCKCAMKGCKSPSTAASPRLVSANRSCQPGRGSGCQYSCQAANDARYAKRQDRIKTGAGVISMIAPLRIETWNGWPVGPSRHSQARAWPRRTRAGVCSSSAGMPENVAMTAASLALESDIKTYPGNQYLGSRPYLMVRTPDPRKPTFGCRTAHAPLRHAPSSISPSQKRMLHLAQIPEQARHDAECLFRNRQQDVLVGRMLRTARIRMRHPHGRQLENVGKDVVGQRTAEIRQHGRRLSRRLADRFNGPIDPGAIEIGARGGKSLGRRNLDHRKAARVQMRADYVSYLVDLGADDKPKLQNRGCLARYGVCRLFDIAR